MNRNATPEQTKGIKCFVYFNLHKKCFSVKALTGPSKGLVIMHTDAVSIAQPEFKVSEAGRQRVLAEKKKNVHAGVVGYIKDQLHIALTDRKVSYNPYNAGHFYTCDDRQPIHNSNIAVMQVSNKIPSIFVG